MAISGLRRGVRLDGGEPRQSCLGADVDPELSLLQGRNEAKVPRTTQRAYLAARLGRLGGLLVQGPTIALQPDGVAGHLIGGAQQVDVSGGIPEMLAFESSPKITLERAIAGHPPPGRLQRISDLTDFRHEDRALGGRRNIAQEIRV